MTLPEGLVFYVLLGVTTISVGELRGEGFLEAQLDTARKTQPSKLGQVVGVTAGVCTAIALWPAYALGMLLKLLGGGK